jgi:hypothetical protein
MSTSTNESPTAISPSLPGTYAEGDLLLLFITTRDVTDTIDGPPSGYTLLAQDNAETYQGGIYLYGKIAGASESSPSFTVLSNSVTSYGMAAFRDSSGVTALGSIVHAVAKGDTANNTAATITYPSLTVSVGNTLILYLLTKNKGIDEATTIATPGTEIGEVRRIAASSSINGWGYTIQTTATNITGSTAALTTWTESSNRPERAIVISLLSAGPQKFLKLLAHSSAQSETGIVGVVFQAPSGSDITGAKIGEFTGAAFESTLESGEAVLKVPVSEFGGGSLTTSDTPVALVRNTTDTTGIVACTVIEE